MKNFGILYFSSTGNSLYIAKKIQEKLDGDVLYIPTYEGNGSEYERIIIVTPIYSYGIPVPVLDLLSKLEKDKELNVIQNYGGMIGGADRLFYEYAVKNGLNIKGVYTMKMPENFTLVMSPPSFIKNSVLKKADNRISKIVTAIERQEFHIPQKKRTKEEKFLKNKGNWHIIGKRFSTTDKCVLCGKCVSICPAHNIKSENGKIVFGDCCIACLGCFHRCPQQAIIYRGKDNKKRYINPNINENEIGRNL